MYIFLFCMVLLTPAVMAAAGKLWTKRPPKEVNDIYGYRTAMSMKNRDTWDFAHRLCGRLWFRSGLVSGIVSAVLMLVFARYDETLSLILVFSQIGLLFLLILPVEAALNRHFDKDGNRKK